MRALGDREISREVPAGFFAASGRIHEVFEPSKPMGIGIDVSPDGQTLLFTQVHTDGADLYMIDGLR